MKIQPILNNIYFRPEKENMPLMQIDAFLEMGEVIAVGEDVKHAKPGNKIFVKGWGVDVIEIGEEKYYFTQENSEFVKAIVANE